MTHFKCRSGVWEKSFTKKRDRHPVYCSFVLCWAAEHDKNHSNAFYIESRFSHCLRRWNEWILFIQEFLRPLWLQAGWVAITLVGGNVGTAQSRSVHSPDNLNSRPSQIVILSPPKINIPSPYKSTYFSTDQHSFSAQITSPSRRRSISASS